MFKRYLLLLLLISLQTCNKGYGGSENVETKPNFRTRFGGIEGTAYDCFNKSLPYASLYLNKMPDTRKMKLREKVFIARGMFFFHDEYMNIQVIADSLGNYLFDTISEGSYQVVLLPFTMDTTGLSSRKPIVDTLEVKPDSFVVLHIEPMPRWITDPYGYPCGQSAIDFVSVKADSCSVVDIHLMGSITNEMKPQIIWNPKYKPCDWRLD